MQKKLLVFTGVLAAMLALVKYSQDTWPISNMAWIALLYFAGVTLLTYSIMNSAVNKDNKTFFVRVYSSIGIRFLLSLAPLAIYLAFSKEKNIPFVVVYIILYMLFSAFEAVMTYRNHRSDKL